MGPTPTSDIMATPRRCGDLIAKMIIDGEPAAAITRATGCNKSTVSYHRRRIGLLIPMFVDYDWGEVQRLHDSGVCRETLTKQFGFSSATWAKAVASGRLLARQIPREVVPYEELKTRSGIKYRLIKTGTLDAKTCAICGISEWMGGPISLELDHIDGDNRNRSVENLRLICPNCHSQTETYSGRNVGRYKQA